MQTAARRTLTIALFAVGAACGLSRFLWLAADFPNFSPWIYDQAKFTDEGWWGNAAVMQALTGHWHVAGDYNPAVALPVWPILLSGVFHFTGVGIIAARAFSVAISLATLVVIYMLVRRFAGSSIAAQSAVVLMAASPFAFAFSRLAILDTLIVFEFCLMMLVASHATKSRIGPLAALAFLVTATLLTKTTAAVLIPAVLWIALAASWQQPATSASSEPAQPTSARARLLNLIPALFATTIVPFALVKAWAALAAWLGYGNDYSYFFIVNAMPGYEWSTTLHWLHDLALNGLWIDRLLYPAAILILVASVTIARGLWRNPLFASSWIAFAGEAVFILRRQDDYAPRYFLVMLAPMVFIAALALDQALRRSRVAAGLLAALMTVCVVLNGFMVGGFLVHREYQLYSAAQQIGAIVRAGDPRRQLLYGVGAAEIGIIAGLTSINAGFGIEDRAQKTARYQPGWYLAWNTEADPDALKGWQIVPVATYFIFDDDGRTCLTMYKMQATERQGAVRQGARER